MTLEDLLVEFYEDHFEENPSEARKALSKNGEYYFAETGDPLLDKWEEELARGLEPDFEEGLSQEAKAKLKKERERYKSAATAVSNHNVPLQDPRYKSKFAAPGSREDKQLRQGKAGVLGAGQSTNGWVDMLGDD